MWIEEVLVLRQKFSVCLVSAVSKESNATALALARLWPSIQAFMMCLGETFGGGIWGGHRIWWTSLGDYKRGNCKFPDGILAGIRGSQILALNFV